MKDGSLVSGLIPIFAPQNTCANMAYLVTIKNTKSCLLILVVLFSGISLLAQQDRLHLFEVPDSLNKTRFWVLNSGIAASYTGTMVALSTAWYADYPRDKFHFFNDYGEWLDIDKSGHFFSAYFESKWTKHLYQWTGMDDRKSAYMGAAGGMLFQGGIEILDGFSSEWGFSWWDIAFNAAGSGTFLGQELLWQEQRIHLKLSAHLPKYDTNPIQAFNSEATTTVKDRAAELYGTSPASVMLKEYNGLTLWASGNIHAFIQKEDSRFPKWLNIAFGYSAENVFSGFNNQWVDDDGNLFILDPEVYPRYRQFIIAPDVDFTRIPTKSRGLKIFFGLLNVIKIPSPAIEFNTRGKLRFYPLYF